MLDRLALATSPPQNNRGRRTTFFTLCIALGTAGLLASVFLFSSLKLIWTAVLVALFVSELFYRRAGGATGSRDENVWFSCLLLAGSVTLCIIGLADTWKTGQGNYFSLGGLIPYSDAAGYYSGALSLLERGTIDGFAARRPLGVLYFALLLKLTGQSLQGALIVSTVLVALSIFYAAHAVCRTWGITAGIIVMLGVFGIAREFFYTTMTEPPGLMCASIAAGLLWSGIFMKRRWRFIWGLGVLALALGIRSGAWFVVPLLLGYGMVRWRGKKFVSGAIAVSGLAAVALSLFVNIAVLRVVAPTDAGHFNANFSYTLYGLVKGGKGWTAVAEDFPEERLRLNDAEFCRFAYKASGREFMKHPWHLVTGIGRGYAGAFARSSLFFHPLTGILPKGFRGILLLCGIAVMVLSIRGKDGSGMLLGLVLFGTLISAPFLIDAFRRALTATYPFAAIVYAAGPGIVMMRLARPHASGNEANSRDVYALFGYIVVPLAVISATFALRIVSPKFADRILATSAISKGEDTIIFRASRGSFVELLPDSARTRIPGIATVDFKRGNTALMENGALKIAAGRFFGTVFDLAGDRSICSYLILDRDPARFAGSIVRVPVKKITGEKHVFYQGTGDPVPVLPTSCFILQGALP
jgi:hypothetical protein